MSKKEVKTDENLMLGKYAEEFISSYSYVEKGVGLCDESYLDIFRKEVSMPVEEKVLLAMGLTDHSLLGLEETLSFDSGYKRNVDTVFDGVVFTNRGIYKYKRDLYIFQSNNYDCNFIHNRFISWRMFANSRLENRGIDIEKVRSWKIVDSPYTCIWGSIGKRYKIDVRHRIDELYTGGDYCIRLYIQDVCIGEISMYNEKSIYKAYVISSDFFPSLQQYIRSKM